MAIATWNGAILAESDHCEIVEGNYYFPPDSLRQDYFRASNTHTLCGWKGQASYYTLVVNGEENKDAAWYYPEPKEKAQQIQNYVAFWRGVTIQK